MNTQESRDAFEKAYRPENLSPRDCMPRDEFGNYVDYVAQIQWDAWQASRAALKGPVDVERLVDEIRRGASQEVDAWDMRSDYADSGDPLPQEWKFNLTHEQAKQLLTKALSSYSVQRDVEEGRLREILEEAREYAVPVQEDRVRFGTNFTGYVFPRAPKLRAALLPTEPREDGSDV